ncbi:hypothetical protein LCGC14_1011200 [marine sediment metagenome]|uniref:Uncharacterized protein n=1 Tax=marine sediment metagenome TaxID=412755 RepID=A0A0F9NLL6_9ZZZZ
MGKVNISKLKQRQAEEAKGGEFIKFDEGISRLYLHPPCEPNDDHDDTEGLPWLNVGVHYKVGPNVGMAICLDKGRNPIITHPIVEKFLGDRKTTPNIDLDAGCPVCQALPDMTDDEKSDRAFQVRHLWGVTLMGYRRDAADDWRAERTPKPRVWMGGASIHGGFQGEFSDDDDITDMDRAMLVQVTREGTGPRNTKYGVESDKPTIKKPMNFPKALRRVILDAMEDDCNLFQLIANMLKGTEELRAALSGVAIAEDDRTEDEPDAPPEGGPDYEWQKGTPLPKPCFANAEDITDDQECGECAYKWACADLCGVAVPGEEPEPEPEPEPAPENETKADRRARLNRAKAAKEKAGDHPSGLTKEELGTDDAQGDDLDEVERELEEASKKTTKTAARSGK